MSVVLLASATGAPGVTTTAVGLSLLWEGEILLADCDRTASQAVLAGYLQGLVAPGLGLPGLATVHRQGGQVSAALLAQTVPLADGEPRRHLLPGFAHAAAPLVFDTVWGDIGDALATASRSGIDVLIDAGRIGAAGLPAGLLAHADAVLILTRSNLVALAGLRLHVAGVREALSSRPGAGLGLLVVGPGRPYSAREIEHEFALPVWSEIDHQPDLAAVFSDGAASPRRFTDSGYVRSLRTTASAITSRMTAREQRIGRHAVPPSASPTHPQQAAAPHPRASPPVPAGP